MSLVYLFLCLCVLTLGCTAVALLAFCILAWVKKWKIFKWISSVATVIVGAACVLLNFALTTEGERPFLRKAPVEKDIPGVYVLDADSAAGLMSKGYTNLSVQVSLKEDRTFEIRQVPHLWLYGSSYRAGYDTCFGDWRIVKPVGTTRYSVRASFSRFEVDSAYLGDTDKGDGTLGRVLFDIVAKTKQRPYYGLAVPLNCGDEGYIFFRRLNAQDTVQPTEATPSRSVDK